MKKMKFKNGKEMLEEIQSGTDLYNPRTEQYAFLYNESGSIAVYTISNEHAAKLEKLAKEQGEYWGAFLGSGGSIYDDPSYEDYEEENYSNLDWCNDNYEGDWEDVSI